MSFVFVFLSFSFVFVVAVLAVIARNFEKIPWQSSRLPFPLMSLSVAVAVVVIPWQLVAVAIHKRKNPFSTFLSLRENTKYFRGNPGLFVVLNLTVLCFFGTFGCFFQRQIGKHLCFFHRLPRSLMRSRSDDNGISGHRI